MMKKLIVLCLVSIFIPAQASLRQICPNITRAAQAQRTFATKPVVRQSFDTLQKEYVQQTQKIAQEAQQSRMKLDTMHAQDQKRSVRTSHGMLTLIGAAYVAAFTQIFNSVF